ncbi:MAG TPA: DEAD/DEAH box helicase [Desulfobacterales bacterium]|nr:DEAD/DEAH box helicase [Desulfobacterales bacterium]
MTTVEETRTIRRRLRYAWNSFFTRFGRLTPVQLETIPKVLDGANVIVASPTATGKTEAVVAPLAEKYLAEEWERLSVLYVVPTRALANDTLVRVEGPLRDVGITATLKHGDKPYLSPKKLPNFLITTPESLDSLICRHPNLFSTLRAIVLDEIHLLDNTYRGDQLRLLLRRFDKLAADKNFSTHLLSATLSAPFQIARRYVNKFEVIKVGEERRIDHHILNSLEEGCHFARRRGWRKLLCFCNKRESVEEVSAKLAPLWHPYPVVAHHGSLSRPQREEAETVMKEADAAVCVATSTLEVGIDIGDIDLIVLAEIPWSISSLLQRIGRGNRREDVNHVLVIVRTGEEKRLMEAMFDTVISGALPMEPYRPDKSVAVQQVFSYLYQNRCGTDEAALLELLSPLCSESEARLILSHLRGGEWLEYRTRRWCASTRLIDWGETGRVHSNIPDDRAYMVVDIDTDREVGTIGGVFDEVFVLAGKVWRTVSVDSNTVRVRRFRGQAEPALFRRRKKVGAFNHLLPMELRLSP